MDDRSDHPAPAEDALVAVADHLDGARFDLAGPDRERWRVRASGLVRLLRGVTARAARPDAPLLVVVAGGSGAGKSTTVNSLVGARVAAASVVRPTTRAPVLVHHPSDAASVADADLLPHLSRVSGGDDVAAAAGRLVLRTSDGLPPGLAVIDTPDIDSVETANHRLAEDVLDAADVWVWLATGRTYADEVGMTHLRRARDRHVLRAVVVTQVRPPDREEILADVRRLLADEAIDPEAVLDVPFAPVDGDRVPAEAVASLRAWLDDLARPDARAAVRRRALDGLRAAVPAELAPVAAVLDDEVAAAARLRDAIASGYAPVHDQLTAELEAGIPLRAEVLDRWRDLVGVGDVMARVQTAGQRVRSMVRGLGGGRGPVESPRQVQAEVAGTLTETLVRLLERASWDVRRRWERDPTGREVLDAAPDLRGQAGGRPSPDDDREPRVRPEVDAWGEHVAHLVATVGAERRASARRWSTALNAVATSAILVVFAVSGGLTGGEVGIAALAAAGSQALLVKLFGEQNLRRLLEDVHADLDARLGELAVRDAAAYEAAVAAAEPAPELVAAVHALSDRSQR